MKALLIIPILFCLQDTAKVDTVKVDTTQQEVKLFFEQKTVMQRAEDISIKLDLLIARLQAKNDSVKLK